MGNRMIKETIRTSKSVNSMSDFQFRLWVYLITYVDDYGRGSADPEIIKGFVLPRRKGVTEQQIAKALAEMANTGIVHLYEVDGEPYFCFPNWSKHQRVQQKRSKFPEPPEFTECDGNSPYVTVGHGNSPPETETEVETEIKTETEHISGGGGARRRTRKSDAASDFLAERSKAPQEYFGYTDELLAQCSVLAVAIFKRFCSRQPTAVDVDNVFFAVVRAACDDAGTWTGRIDEDAKGLLMYAFEAAANAGKPGEWPYINGVMERCYQRGIKTAEDADQYDFDRNYDAI